MAKTEVPYLKHRFPFSVPSHSQGTAHTTYCGSSWKCQHTAVSFRKLDANVLKNLIQQEILSSSFFLSNSWSDVL